MNEDLLTLASELIENNNYKNDTYASDNRPDGDYRVVLKQAEFKEKEETGTTWFALTFDILTADYVGEKFFVNLFLTEKTTKRTLTTIMRLVSSMGYELDPLAFKSTNSILKVLKSLIDNETILNKKTSKGGFINYSFEANNIE